MTYRARCSVCGAGLDLTADQVVEAKAPEHWRQVANRLPEICPGTGQRPRAADGSGRRRRM